MKAILTVFAIAFVVAFPVSAWAACPNITGPYSAGGSFWYQYQWDRACAGTSGSVSTASLSCFSAQAHQFTGSGTVIYSYTVGASDPMFDPDEWQISQFVDFNDPINSTSNTLNLTVSVTSGGSTTSYPFLQWDGQDGDLSCSRRDYYFFHADVGDTITVTITATNVNSPSTVIKVGIPTLFNGV